MAGLNSLCLLGILCLFGTIKIISTQCQAVQYEHVLIHVYGRASHIIMTIEAVLSFF